MSSEKRNIIIYVPYHENGIKITNEYISNMSNILKDKYFVTGFIPNLVSINRMLRTKAIFLNWVEETELDTIMKVQLMIHRLFGVKIIWVFHNRFPHDSKKSKKIIKNMKWLAHYSKFIIIHSKSSLKYLPDYKYTRKKAVYIPHIVYKTNDEHPNVELLRSRYDIDKNDFIFTIFGKIRPYKNIEAGIRAFNKLHLKNAKLVIAGSPVDLDYARKIKKLCNKNENIILDFRFLPAQILNNLIYISDIIVMPYKKASCMNSGVMIQAFSKGKTVITPDLCMARDMYNNKFFYMYHDCNSLETVMLNAYKNGKKVNEEMGKEAKSYVMKNNNRRIVKYYLYNLLK